MMNESDASQARSGPRVAPVRVLPNTGLRVETGPVQFGDDWPGLFIRGDDALYRAMRLGEYLKGGDSPFGTLRAEISSLRSLLASVQVQPGEPAAPTAEGDGGGWRTEVVAFAGLMEAKLRENDHKPGWQTDLPQTLYSRLEDECQELAMRLGAFGQHLLTDSTTQGMLDQIGSEAADVANFAMMIADVCGALPAARSHQGEDTRPRSGEHHTPWGRSVERDAYKWLMDNMYIETDPDRTLREELPADLLDRMLLHEDTQPEAKGRSHNNNLREAAAFAMNVLRLAAQWRDEGDEYAFSDAFNRLEQALSDTQPEPASPASETQ